MTYQQLLASYPDDLAKHAATSGWNAANTAMLNAIMDQITVATEAGNYSTASTLFKLLDNLQPTLALKRV
jgi:hypothetical protein